MAADDGTAAEDAGTTAAEAAAELGRTLDGVRRTARGIASDLGEGLEDAVVEGKRLETVMAGIATRLSGRFLDAALAPLERIVAQGIGAVAGTAAGVAAGGGGLPTAAPASPQAPVSVTFNVTTPDVEGFRRSEARTTAMLARAVGRGRRGL